LTFLEKSKEKLDEQNFSQWRNSFLSCFLERFLNFFQTSMGLDFFQAKEFLGFFFFKRKKPKSLHLLFSKIKI